MGIRRGNAVVALIVAALCAIGPAPLGARQSFDSLVVFGTSLSDPGNAFAFVPENNTPPDYDLDPFLVPDTVYPRGGHHLSNGATWIEQLARSLGMARDVQAAFQSQSAGAMNFAVGGARARIVANNPHLTFQVGAYLLKTGGVASEDSLYVIEIGSTDVRDAVLAALSGGNPTAIRQQAIAAITANITALHSRGARNFLVWNVPDLALVPAIQRLNQLVPGAAALATLHSTLFNTDLATAIANLSALPQIHIETFDIFGLLHAVVANPTAYGIENVDEACVTPNVPPFTCQRPDEYLFWDGLHPTKAGHAILAEEVQKLLGL